MKSTIELAHSHGIRICAEGVKTAAVMNQLNHWGCDVVQDFYVSRAIPASEITKFVDNSHGVIEVPAKDSKTVAHKITDSKSIY